ncbi:MAG: septal ring lytic transglycosylase RlpA family protein [Alphaproteobacteria bacterium]
MNHFRSLLFSLFAMGLLGACAETTFLAHATKEFQQSVGLNGKSGKTIYKVGKPYEINGIWYYPKVNYKYAETGIASWYGPNFHRKKTANGEIFDMNGVSAAHRTLPMPSLVRVTNLKSGRAINVRINDRGPFAHGRIIDLSRRAAQLLGFEHAGTAPVRVEILAEESRQLAAAAQNLAGRTSGIEPKKPDSAPTVSVTSSTLPPPAGAKAARPPSDQFKVSPVTQGPAKTGRSKPSLAVVDEKVTFGTVTEKPKIFVQAGAFSRFQNAHKVRAVLKQLGPTKIMQVDVNQRPLFRVRIGPFYTVESADEILATVIKAGYPDAATIVE